MGQAMRRAMRGERGGETRREERSSQLKLLTSRDHFWTRKTERKWGSRIFASPVVQRRRLFKRLPSPCTPELGAPPESVEFGGAFGGVLFRGCFRACYVAPNYFLWCSIPVRAQGPGTMLLRLDPVLSWQLHPHPAKHTGTKRANHVGGGLSGEMSFRVPLIL